MTAYPREPHLRQSPHLAKIRSAASVAVGFDGAASSSMSSARCTVIAHRRRARTPSPKPRIMAASAIATARLCRVDGVLVRAEGVARQSTKGRRRAICGSWPLNTAAISIRERNITSPKGCEICISGVRGQVAGYDLSNCEEIDRTHCRAGSSSSRSSATACRLTMNTANRLPSALASVLASAEVTIVSARNSGVEGVSKGVPFMRHPYGASRAFTVNSPGATPRHIAIEPELSGAALHTHRGTRCRFVAPERRA